MKPLSVIDLQQVLDDFAAQGFGVGGAVNAPPTSSPKSRPLPGQGQVLGMPCREDLAVLQDALSHISPDIPRGNGSIIGTDGQPEPDYWFGAVLAARREYGDAAKEVMRRWSQQSLRYGDGSGFEHAWAQYDPHHPKPVTIGSLFRLAKLNGWAGVTGNSSLPSPASLASASFRLLDRAAIMALPPLAWRVKGIFPEVGIGAIYGPSASGKSFLGFDLGISVASGKPWFGHRVSPGPVTYIMLEAEAGLRNRIEAWEKHNGQHIPAKFLAIAQPFDLSNPDKVEELGAVVPQGGVIFIDTLNRAAPGLDENSSQDMGRVLAGMKRLQELTGGLVLIVHHTGKDASKGLRGHSSLFAALDGAIEVERSATGRCWSAAKVKDGEDGKQIAFRLHVVDLGKDADGDPMNSCAVERDVGAMFRPNPPQGQHQKSALAVIRSSLGSVADFGKAGTGQQTPCLRLDEAVKIAADALVGVDKKRRTPRAREAVQGLVIGGHLRRGLDGEQEEWVWL
jgi:AAA domain/Primase C terminal 2 (PriCT-2)